MYMKQNTDRATDRRGAEDCHLTYRNECHEYTECGAE